MPRRLAVACWLGVTLGCGTDAGGAPPGVAVAGDPAAGAASGAGDAGGAVGSDGGAGDASRPAPAPRLADDYRFGAPEILAEGITFPARLAVDDRYVYWGDRRADAGKVVRAPKVGGEVVVIADGQRFASGILLDLDYVYWSTATAGFVRARRAGGGLEPLSPDIGLSADLVADATRFFAAGVARSAVFAIDRESLAVTRIADGLGAATRLAIDDRYLYFNDGGLDPDWEGSVKAWPLAGGVTRTLAQRLPAPQSIAVTTNHVYWVNAGVYPEGGTATPGSLARVALDDGVPRDAPLTLLTSMDEPFGLAVDARHAYVTLRAERSGSPPGCAEPRGSLLAYVLDTGEVTTLAEGLDCPSSIVVDDSGVYWINGGGVDEIETGSIMRIPKLPGGP